MEPGGRPGPRLTKVVVPGAGEFTAGVVAGFTEAPGPVAASFARVVLFLEPGGRPGPRLTKVVVPGAGEFAAGVVAGFTEAPGPVAASFARVVLFLEPGGRPGPRLTGAGISSGGASESDRAKRLVPLICVWLGLQFVVTEAGLLVVTRAVLVSVEIIATRYIIVAVNRVKRFPPIPRTGKSELTRLGSAHFHPRTASTCRPRTTNVSSMRTVQPSIRTWISRPWSSPTCSASRPASTSRW